MSAVWCGTHDDESRITEFDEKPIEAHPTPFPQVSMSSEDDSS